MKFELDDLSLEAKREKSYKLIADNPGKLPVILKKAKNSKIELPHVLYLVSSRRTLSEFIYSIRKSLSIPKTEGFYLFISDRLPALNMTILQLYERLSEEDGFLYFTYTTQEDKVNSPISDHKSPSRSFIFLITKALDLNFLPSREPFIESMDKLCPKHRIFMFPNFELNRNLSINLYDLSRDIIMTQLLYHPSQFVSNINNMKHFNQAILILGNRLHIRSGRPGFFFTHQATRGQSMSNFLNFPQQSDFIVLEQLVKIPFNVDCLNVLRYYLLST